MTLCELDRVPWSRVTEGQGEGRGRGRIRGGCMEKVALAWSMKDGWEITSQKGREQREQRGSGAEQVAECGLSLIHI